MPFPFAMLLRLSILPLAALAAPAHLGSFPCKAGLTAGPGFASFTPSGDVLISQFTGDPLEKDGVALISGIAAALASNNASSLRCKPLTDAVSWPNFVDALSLPGFSGAVAPGGFLVPPKTIGAVTLLPIDWAAGALSGAPLVLSAPKVLPGDGWFYHRAVLHDVDGDGLLDVIAARATKPLVAAPAGELVWLRQPASQPFAPASLPWAERVLRAGAWAPDVGFTAPASLRGDADEQIFFTSCFTGGGLAMLNCAGCAPGGGAAWATANLTLTVLDASLGPSFDVSLADLDGDGAPELLVTNHADNATAPHVQSQVAAYKAPAAPAPLTAAAGWARHVLAEGFAIREPGPNQAAPGEATAVRLAGGGKPVVLVSGDGEQRYSLLTPASQQPADWGYARAELFDCGGTTGKQAVGVVGGRTVAFLPCYDAGTMQVFALD